MMKRLTIILLALAVLVAGCSSDSDEESTATEPEVEATADASTGTAVPTAIATEAPTAEPVTPAATSGVEFDCDSQEETSDVNEAVGRIVFCLPQAPQSLIDQSLNQLLGGSGGPIDQEVFGRLTETYGNEAVLVLTSSTIGALSLVLNEPIEETDDTAAQTSLDVCIDSATGFGGEVVLDTAALDAILTCVGEASQDDLQKVVDDFAETFGSDNTAELVRLYGIEPTIVIPAMLGLTVFVN